MLSGTRFRFCFKMVGSFGGKGKVAVRKKLKKRDEVPLCFVSYFNRGDSGTERHGPRQSTCGENEVKRWMLMVIRAAQTYRRCPQRRSSARSEYAGLAV